MIASFVVLSWNPVDLSSPVALTRNVVVAGAEELFFHVALSEVLLSATTVNPLKVSLGYVTATSA